MLVARHTSLFRTTREAHEQLASSDFHVVMISVSALALAYVAYNDAENMLA
jgi:methylmalonyl-CoA mutase cobalamin-binding subunit